MNRRKHFRSSDKDYGLRSKSMRTPSSGFSYSESESYENDRVVNPNARFIPDEPNRDLFNSWSDDKYADFNGKMSDEDITDFVHNVLARHPDIDASQIQIETRSKVVILRGTVETRRIKRLIEDVVYGLPSIRDVQNRLEVLPPDPDRRRISRSLA